MQWVLLFCVLVGLEGSRVVELRQGRVRGLSSVSGQDRYYGIPYAVARRFQPPQPPPKWNGIFDAVDRFSSCAQRVNILTLGKEDCLHLDVFTPENAKPSHKLPVSMFIHGGGYYYGTKAHYDPEFLVVKNTISVIINYRVGVLGFLCIKDAANLGLKDQVAALKWIQTNIAAFGGDPDNVTLFGQSAGASAAAMLMLSPSARGLFHKMILLSGTALTPWAFNLDPLTPALQDARKLGNATTKDDVFEIFNKAPVRDLMRATLGSSIDTRYFKYTPCIDSNSSEPFFPDLPYNLIKTGNFHKVPVISGFTDLEGMLFYGLHNEATLKDYDMNFKDKLPSIFSWCSEDDKLRISKKIRRHYFGDEEINSSKVRGLVDYYSDWIAYSSVEAFSSLLANHSDQPVYNYMFSYIGQRNFAGAIFGSRVKPRRASHSDDIFYIFKPAGLPLLLAAEDRLFIDRLTFMLTNFMKTGNPTPKKSRLLPVRWSPYVEGGRVLRLDTSLTMQPLPPSHRGQFWLQLMCAHGHPGHVPCDSSMDCNHS